MARGPWASNGIPRTAPCGTRATAALRPLRRAGAHRTPPGLTPERPGKPTSPVSYDAAMSKKSPCPSPSGLPHRRRCRSGSRSSARMTSTGGAAGPSASSTTATTTSTRSSSSRWRRSSSTTTPSTPSPTRACCRWSSSWWAWPRASSARRLTRVHLLGRHREHLPGGPDLARPQPGGPRHRRSPRWYRRDGSPGLREGGEVPRHRAGVRARDRRRPAGRRRPCRHGRRPHRARGRLRAVLPLRGHRRHPRDRGDRRRAGRALPRRRLSRRVAASLVRTARRGGAARGTSGFPA